MHPIKETINSVRFLQQVALRFVLSPMAVVRSGFAVASELSMERRIGVRTAYRGFERPASRLSDSTPSQPISYGALEQIERDITHRGVSLRSFVDLGCGRGRALAYFSKLPFEEVAGVEVDPHVARVAEENMGRIQLGWKRAGPVTIVVSDAADYEIPSDRAVLLLTNPFGEATLRVVLTRLRAKLALNASGVVHAYYAYPVHHRVFREVFPGVHASSLSCRDPSVYHYRLALEPHQLTSTDG